MYHTGFCGMNLFAVIFGNILEISFRYFRQDVLFFVAYITFFLLY